MREGSSPALRLAFRPQEGFFNYLSCLVYAARHIKTVLASQSIPAVAGRYYPVRDEWTGYHRIAANGWREVDLFSGTRAVDGGVCIVISPLIALMKDQVEQLKSRGILAVAIHSGMSKHEIDVLLDNCVFGNVKFLYVSPERVQTEIFAAA